MKPFPLTAEPAVQKDGFKQWVYLVNKLYRYFLLEFSRIAKTTPF